MKRYEIHKSLADDYFGTDDDEVTIVSQQWQQILSDDGEYQQWLDMLDAQAHQQQLEERRQVMDISGLRQKKTSKWMKADDVGDARPTYIVEDVKVEQFPDFNDRDTMVDKVVLYFVGSEQCLPLSPGNLDECASAWGENTDSWAGRTVMLKTTFYEGLGKSGIVVTAFPADVAPAAPSELRSNDDIPI